MKNKVTKYGLMTIAAVLLVAMAFAGAASADSVDISSAEQWNAFAANTANYNKDINITESFSFDGVTPTVLGNNTYSYSGNISGNGKTISNFTISGSDENLGLIGRYGGSKISNLTIKNFSVSGSDDFVGGLVGTVYLYPGECTIENVSVEFGSVVSSSHNVGGLVGQTVTADVRLVNCTAENCSIASEGNNVGGLIGFGQGCSFLDNSSVVNCSVSGSCYVGGLVGYAAYAIKSEAELMQACSVTNCIVSGFLIAGGLVGESNYASPKGFKQCVVENSTIVGKGDRMGGLVGCAGDGYASVFKEGNQLIASAVRGSGTTVAKISGDNPTLNEDSTNVTQIEPVWLNNNNNAQYPKIYVAKSTDPEKQGPESPGYFNDTVADAVPEGAKLITQLTGYGPNGKYAALAYVYEDLTYDVTITNATGSYLLMNQSNTVYGDTGYAKATKEGDVVVLTLNDFKVNKAGCTIISSTAPDLKIVLNGESNLTGNCTSYGLLYSAGNLTLTATNGGKLLVNNTNTKTASTSVVSIKVVKNLTIEDGANVIAIANATNYGEAYAIQSADYLVIKDSAVTAKAIGGHDYVQALAGNTIAVSGENTVIEAIAIDTNKSFAAYAFSGLDSITIVSAEKITAIASSVYRNASSFAYFESGSRDFSGLATGYTFSNATNQGAAPTSYAVFNDSNNWHLVDDETDRTVSNYTAVTIEKGSTPAPYTPSSSSKHSGSTVILSEGQTAPTAYATAAPTVAPTVKPTATPTPATPTVIATAAPTTQPTETQKSPAPVLGIIAGLGAAAVLLRLRK